MVSFIELSGNAPSLLEWIESTYRAQQFEDGDRLFRDIEARVAEMKTDLTECLRNRADTQCRWPEMTCKRHFVERLKCDGLCAGS
jgi:hypothetical protein